MLAAAGDQDQRGGNIALGERNLRGGGCAESRCHAGDDLSLDSSLPQCLQLFATTAEDERISAFESDDLQSHQRVLDQEAIDFLLRSAFPAAALANVDDLSGNRNQAQDFVGDKFVMQDYVGGAENFRCFEREQIGIAGARAYQEYSGH